MTVRESPAPSPPRPGPAEGEDRWHLRDERDFLLRSLADAEREHDAGDLSDDDHAVLVARDTARLAEVEAALAALGPDAAPLRASVQAKEAGESRRPPLSLWRRLGIVAACGLIVAGGVVLVVHFVQARQPGQAASGTVTVSQAQQIEQELQQAAARNNKGDTKGALELYDKVLSVDPSNPAALAYGGWLQWNVGSSAHVASLVRIGRSEIQTAVKDAPSFYEAHLFLGLVLENQDHNEAAAVAQFDQYLAGHPPAAELAQAAPLVAGAYQAVGRQLPPQLADAMGTGKGSSAGTGTSAPAGSGSAP
jgi:tetratricopeptide (TPR) repeat protein